MAEDPAIILESERVALGPLRLDLAPTYEKAGLREIGRRRGAVVSFGRRHDEVLMDAVADEWRSPVLGALAPS